MFMKNYKTLIGIFVMCVIIVGGLSAFRLFSWDTLAGAHKFFYVSYAVLFLYGLFIALSFAKIPDDLFAREKKIPPIVEPRKVDPELEALRKDLEESRGKVIVPENPRPYVSSVPEPVDLPSTRIIPTRRLTDDFSMYEDRNILKPPTTQEYKVQEKDVNEYNNIF
jgi:hypothetical protein